MPKETGSLTILREDRTISGNYTVTFSSEGGCASMEPLIVNGPERLIELLAEIGVDFDSAAVREALKQLLLHGSASIPGIELNPEEAN